MKSKNTPTVLISVVLAVVLWLVATLLEDDARWLPEVPDESIDVSQPAPREDSDLKINTDVMSCEQAEAEIVQMVDDARYCSTDDDCTLFDYGYPIECLTSVAKDEITALRLEYRRYEQSCSYRVYYDCPSGEMQREAVCRNNRCEVDLVTDEVLKDLTLRHLGIERQ
jgi:hypothetical protein